MLMVVIAMVVIMVMVILMLVMIMMTQFLYFAENPNPKYQIRIHTPDFPNSIESEKKNKVIIRS